MSSELPPVPVRPSTALPLSAYGNHVTVACPCSTVMIARSMGDPGKGASECGCGRWFKGFPDGGHRITHVIVWESGDNSVTGSYAVEVPEDLHQAAG